MAYTTIDDPSAHFQTTLYSSDGGGGSISVTNGGNSDLQPDLLWIKVRNGSNDHNMFDSSRSNFGERIFPNQASASDSVASVSASSDGFATGTGYGDINNTSGANNYVAWQWKANGGTTSSLSGGDIGITTTSQANSTAKFSINTYTGTGSQSAIGHGLGEKPDWIMIRNRDANDSWFVWNQDLNNNQALELDSTSAVLTNNAYMGNEAPTATTVGLGTGHDTNADGEKYVCYAFAEVQGYSKFGSYTGNGDSNGPFVYTGFKPQWIMFKNTGAAEEWVLQDTVRNPINPVTKNIRVDSNIAEADASTLDIDFLSNGFKNRSDQAQLNSSGVKYAYFAFAERPFVTSGGAPTTAR